MSITPLLILDLEVEHWTTDSLSVLKYRRRTQPNTRYEARRLPVPKGRSCFPSKPVPQEDIPIPTIEQYDTVYTMYRIQHHSSKPVLDRRSMCPSPTPPALGPKLFPNARPSRRVSKQSSISRGGSGDMISREELQYAFDWKKRTMEA